MIRFSCPECEKGLAAPPEKAGASTTCPFCRTAVTVPAAVQNGPPPSETPPVAPEPEPARSLFSAKFLADLKLVHDAEIDKDPDDLVPILAQCLERRRSKLRESRGRFFADLKAVYEAEGGKDPEEYLPVLSARLDRCRSQSIERIREHLSILPEDDPLLCAISLFGTLGLGRTETAHTSALKWLLDPRADHGFGTCLIDALMTYLANGKAGGKLSVHEIHKEHPLVLQGKSLGRIDIYGIGSWTHSGGTADEWMLAIEGKIDAGEGDRQLERYDEWIDAHRGNRTVYRVFLTPDGRQSEVEGNWIRLSFLDLARIFREPYLGLRDMHGFHFFRFYLAGVLKDICRWKTPLGKPETCDDPYGIAEYLQTVSSSNQGEVPHGSRR